MKLPHTFLIACLGAAPLCAQQVEPKNDAQKPAAAEDAGANGGVKTDAQPSGRPSRAHVLPQPEQKPVAYIGVLTREVPAELRAQLSLAEGFGLLVEEVLPDSPAKGSGLKVYDVLVKFEDQQLVNMEQFMALVRAKKKGDVVQLDVISGGKETKVAVTLGEHLVTANPDHHSHPGFAGPGQTQGMPGYNGEQRGFQNQNNALHEQFERLRNLQQELREYQERVQQWSKGGGIGPIPPAPMFNLPGHGQQPEGGGRFQQGRQRQTGISIPPGTNLQRFNYSQSQSAANVTRRDDSGEYTLKNEDGKKTFTVRPKNGQEQSWPINNDKERQAVPQEFQNKLQTMDGPNSGIRIEIHPGPESNVPGSPAPKGDDNAPAVPPVKGRATSA